jgi:PAS domain S-box-containing protein
MPNSLPSTNVQSASRADTRAAAKPDIFRAAIEGCPAGLFVVNAVGVIVVANAALERQFGYPHAELSGQPLQRLLPAHVRGHPVPEHGTFTARRRNGSEFAAEIGIGRVQIDGAAMMVGTIVDVSAQKRRDQLKDAFIATLSHELRTPITSIRAALGLLLSNAGNTLSPPAAQLIEIAHANCQRLIRLTSDVLDLNRLESGRMTLRYQRADAGALLQCAIDANRALAGESKVGIRFDTPRAPVALYVDPDRFMQVMTNLLSNAIKFSPPGEDVIVALEKQADRVHISVRDRGPGIPAAFKPRVFEAFSQFDSDLVRQKGGSGLGLSIARRIVTEMHGKIEFDDATGGGTIFSIDLPDADFFQRWQEELARKETTVQTDHSTR